VGGERWLPELTVPWLPGYENSRPVRIGNAASQQLQTDVFGEIADAMFQARKAGMARSERGRALRSVVLEHLEAAWRQPDEGIWETRGGRQHFVHSKVMAWVAFDRAANEPEAQAFNESGRRWREIADEIHAEVCERGFDPDLNSFVQAYGSKRLDASLLLIPLVGFLPAADPRIQGTLRAIEDRLLIDGEFVLRYETENADGLPEGEGAFLACSFWLPENEEGFQWWNAIAFSESAQTELMRLDGGDALSVQGVMKAGTYEKDGVTKLSLSIVADHVLALRPFASARQPGKKADGGQAGRRETTFDDLVPF
jgi:GH15 family glucan-1,4-alpha-glucosidase